MPEDHPSPLAFPLLFLKEGIMGWSKLVPSNRLLTGRYQTTFVLHLCDAIIPGGIGSDAK
ncbi:MAG: hypothetical protein ACHQQQ_10775 [Bacteroidota bacterium]